MGQDYKALYEAWATEPGDFRTSIGGGDFDLVGRVELAILKREGLQPTSALLDFGCGVGRLALHVLPYLSGGRYLGLDIAPTMIDNARTLVRDRLGQLPAERHRFEVNTEAIELSWGRPYDMICAFSVFTHMEHEDAYRYMMKFHGLLCSGGKLVCSVLPLETDLARKIFIAEAAMPLQERWARVRNVATSYTAMEQLATMVGFNSVRWYRGNEYAVRLDDGKLVSPAQSAMVAQRL
jgi:SAM-dependent methyltransferase